MTHLTLTILAIAKIKKTEIIVYFRLERISADLYANTLIKAGQFWGLISFLKALDSQVIKNL